MSLANLFNVPASPADFLVYSFNVQDQHRRIVAAIREQKSITLPIYQLDEPPIGGDIGTWTLQLQDAVNDFTGVLNITGFDFTQVDFEEPGQLASWTFLLG